MEKNVAVDAVVIGEGENTLTEVVESLGKRNIFEGLKGVAYKYQDQIIHNQPRPLIENLDDIPFPAYHLLPRLKRYKSRSRAEPVGYIFTSRGCPSQCTFCSRNFGTFWRPHSANRVVDEISYLVKEHRVRQIDILDDNFTLDINRAAEILDLLAHRRMGIAINLQSGVRVDSVNKELLLKMKKAGVFKIAFGIESGDQNILKKIKKGSCFRQSHCSHKNCQIFRNGYTRVFYNRTTWRHCENHEKDDRFFIKDEPSLRKFLNLHSLTWDRAF